MKGRDIGSTTREEKLLSYVATFQKHQKKNRQGLKVSDKLRKTAETYSAMIPAEARKAAEIIGIPFAVELSNLCQYIYLVSCDLDCLFEEMAVARSRWKKKLYARLVAMTIFECTNDFVFLLGKPFKEKLMKIRLANLDANRKSVHKEIVEFNKTHNVFLKRIRNSVIGHRDHNAEMQIDLIKSLKTDKLYRIGIRYFAWELKLWTLLISPLLNELLARLARLQKKAK